jgi:3-oxoacyl-[acyl-carrier-protein] synthase II
MSSAARRPAGAPVAVSGSGVVSPIGNDLDAFDDALFAGRSAVRPHALDLPGIELPAVPVAGADFDAATVVAPSRVPLDRGTAMALVAAEGAARDAGLVVGAFDGERLGIFWGSGMAGATTFEMTCRIVYAERRRMRPTSVVTAMPNAPVAELALRFGARGAALAYACACASSAVAIGEAMRAIRAGWIDVAIAGGSESLLTPGVLASWQAMRVLTPIGAERRRSRRGAARVPAFCRGPRRLRARRGCRRLRPRVSRASRARAARGAVPSERLRDQLRRRAHHQPRRRGPARAMRAALADAGLDAGAIGYLNAHGTATTTATPPRRIDRRRSSARTACR